MRSAVKRTKKSIPARVIRGNISVIERLKYLDETQLHAVIATDSNGQPYTSIISFALIPDKKGIVFATPESTSKYRNILKNSRVSLLIDTRSNTEKDYMSAESITILGNARSVKKGRKWVELTKIFVKKHPGLEEFINSAETKLVFVELTRCIHVSRFQTVSEWVAE
jgi:heme iron utilization protein